MPRRLEAALPEDSGFDHESDVRHFIRRVPADANLARQLSGGDERTKLIQSDGVTVSRPSCEVHSGTHIDAPLHLLANGQSVTDLGLESMMGRAGVGHVRGTQEITPWELDPLQLPSETT
jgi:hypothetical protein